MRIITWNCNMAYRKKAKYVLALTPDIVIIPECEHPDNLKWDAYTKIPTDICWEGMNINKGLGVFSYSNYKFEMLDEYNPDIKTIIPIRIKNKKKEFILFAVWANNNADAGYQYVGQIWKAIHFYDKILSANNIIFIGDLNSNTIWDKPKRQHNHTAVVKMFQERNIFSVYHKHFNQIQGREEHSTLYMYRHNDKTYHIDYCFASSEFCNRLKDVQIGGYDNWIKFSDHMPLIVDFK
ncbi:MAG: endonuclease/exonuclease/phosphatase family protein [Fimbriimonadaceae bacterium]|nr:endonuclease/exonuclease/phosphatase family protein [Chitinophagales bacterium]